MDKQNTMRLIIESIYPDNDDLEDYIMHTNQGTFLIQKQQIIKLVKGL